MVLERAETGAAVAMPLGRSSCGRGTLQRTRSVGKGLTAGEQALPLGAASITESNGARLP
jgi:hypothetical protein